ncbi:MAG: DUF302 domain-containing protein [Candidatus Acididesulfobacter guangdongensis]|uniref:DUF302 domain-containing protein n=1 Tax=Acididesulfobacter guangdongensis TaxID=2597225 RepID=A0A519BIW3_ACIG2|nr:MAG: DUF302 domain-containing protein [Candidatus Acididesulfobacter guangdongensis]
MKKFIVLFLFAIIYYGGSVNNVFALSKNDKAFYTLKIKKKFKNVVFDLKQSIINDNYAIVSVNPISQGIQGIGKKISKLDVIEFCNLSYAYDILNGNKNYAAFMPCRVAVYKQGKYVVIIGFLPSFALKFFKNNTNMMKKTALKVSRQMVSIINSVKDGF